MEKTSFLRIVAVLTVICAIMAGIVAAVNFFTVDKIAALEQQKKDEAIKVIYSSSDSSIAIEGEYSDKVNCVYEVKEGQNLLGYTVDIVSSGFGGDVTLMVGVNTDGTVAGVCVTGHSETPGIGAKVANKDFLDSFKSEKDFKAISGATISSKAVKKGVDEAVLTVKNIIGDGAK